MQKDKARWATIKSIGLITKERVFIILLWLLILGVAIAHGVSRLGVSNFFPANGDFQNFNVVRRFMDGQAPFADFVAYLGFGHVFVLTLPQYLFGNNFAVSIAISTSVTLFVFALLWYTISKIILKDTLVSTIIALSFVFLNLLRPFFIARLLEDTVLRVFSSALTPGNSARLIRFAIIPLILLFMPRFFEKIQTSFKKFDIKNEIIIASISGASITWSNDGGISFFLAFSFLYALLHLKHKGFGIDLLKSAALYVFVSAISLFAFVTIITRGSPISYFVQTLSVSEYQSWYFGDLNPTSLLDVFRVHITICFAMTTIFVLKFAFTHVGQSEYLTYFWLSGIMLAFTIQSTMYFYGSGGSHTADEGIVLVSFIIAFTYAVKYVTQAFKSLIDKNFIHLNKKNFRWRLSLYPTSIFIILFVFTLSYALSAAREHHGAPYLPGLRAWVGFPDPILINYTVDRIGDNAIFSTYASAVETMTNQFQPSGADYIIHVLGDRQREEYLESFRTANFRYAATAHPRFEQWNYWAIQANWWFHRELFEDYIPIFTNGYQIYWQRRDYREPELQIGNLAYEIENLSDSEVRVTFLAEDGFNGTVDATISYSIKIGQFLRNFNFTTSLVWIDIMNEGLHPIGLRVSSDMISERIPITIVDGYGEIILRSAPHDNSILNVYNVDVESLLLYPFNFAYASNFTDHNWENGIAQFRSDGLIVDNWYMFRIALDGARQLRVDGYTVEITEISFEDNWIVLTIDGDASLFVFPNVFEVLR